MYDVELDNGTKVVSCGSYGSVAQAVAECWLMAEAIPVARKAAYRVYNGSTLVASLWSNGYVWQVA
mgnify:CR=1 FL=1